MSLCREDQSEHLPLGTSLPLENIARSQSLSLDMIENGITPIHNH